MGGDFRCVCWRCQWYLDDAAAVAAAVPAASAVGGGLGAVGGGLTLPGPEHANQSRDEE